MQYRPEIDGLRALAVIPVILFHAGFDFFSGGFIGVDIFFVISGYLITSIIISEKEKKGFFSLINFYERRARRILPALFLVMAASIPFAYLLFVPPDMKDFSQSLFATATFLSNFLFFSESGYFDTATELKPLLHTWSLAVEEQYYILFPLILLSTWKLKRKWVVVILAIVALSSLLLAQWTSDIAPKAAFYLLPTRFWELLIGSFIAFYFSTKKSIKGNQFFSLLGFILILYSIFIFNEHTQFPSFYTLLPTLGTALIIIFTSSKTLIYKILSNKIIVGIGLISYSAYLWHFPLLAFAKYKSFEPLNLYTIIIIIIITFILAYLTWKYVETPTRCVNKFNRKRLVYFSVLGSVAFIMLGIYGHISKGLEYRGEFSKLYPIKYLSTSGCRNNALYEGLCIRGGTKEPEIALIGDSHASAISNQLELALKTSNRSFLLSTSGKCAPLIDFIIINKNKDNCINSRKEAFSKIITNKEIKTVVLYAEWAIYTKGYRDNDRPRLMSYKSNNATSEFDNPRIFKEAIRSTINQLLAANKHIVIIESTPEFHVRVYDNYAKAKHLNLSINDITISTSEYNERNKEVQSIFGQLNNVSFIRTKKLFCNKEVCSGVSADKNILFSDSNHVTEYGAKRIIDQLIALD